MKYTVEAIIKKPIDEVVNLYKNSELYKQWMPGVSNHTMINGLNKETGSSSVYTININGKDYKMKESVIKSNDCEFLATYLLNGTLNTQRTVFKETKEGFTVYQVNESFGLRGFMKVIGFIMPSAFKKQTQKFVNAFKEFVEK